MPKRQATIRTLYKNHLIDLQSIAPSFTECAICPLCLKSVDRTNGSDGHVWPKYIRKKAGNPLPVARVLLCKDCNERAGKFGDTHMQQHEKAKDGVAERPLEVYIPGPLGPHFALRGKITGIHDNTIDSLTFNLKNLSKNERMQFRDLIDSTKVSLNVHSPRDGVAPIAKAGWVQAAYLMAFYTFGYRYIFQPSAQIVYDYIQNSYQLDTKSFNTIRTPSSIQVKICDNCWDIHPNVKLIIPADHTLPPFIEISLLNYHIHLPIDGSKKWMDSFYNEQRPLLAKKLSDESGYNLGDVRLKISCNKADSHACDWDEFFPTLLTPMLV